MKAYIKLNMFTRSYWEWLDARGYTVSTDLFQDGEYLVIEHEGFAGVFHVTPANTQKLIGSHQMLTYTSVCIFLDGEKLSGVKAAARLGELGALIAHPVPPTQRKSLPVPLIPKPEEKKKIKIVKF